MGFPEGAESFDYENVAIGDFVKSNGGQVERLNREERLRLIELLEKAGCRRYWGLGFRDLSKSRRGDS